jgi:four helix bundle protein
LICAARDGVGAGPDAHGARGKGVIMLRIVDVIFEVLRMLRPIVIKIEKFDRNLADQMRRAATSMALNACEASGSRAGTRRQRYFDALGSARETTGALRAAMAWGYVADVDAVLLDKLDHIRAVLSKNVC